MSGSLDLSAECFLCAPDERLVYMRDESFFAMLGLGPLGEGYSLIAANEHVTSMLDLGPTEAAHLTDFTMRVRTFLGSRGYPPAVATEHGRVALCLQSAARRHEPHCLHAHRLLYPGAAPVDLRAVANEVQAYEGFAEAHRSFRWSGQYLYSESAAGRCWLAAAPRPVPRQLLRGLVAENLGMRDAADWQAKPRIDVVEESRRRLAL